MRILSSHAINVDSNTTKQHDLFTCCNRLHNLQSINIERSNILIIFSLSIERKVISLCSANYILFSFGKRHKRRPLFSINSIYSTFVARNTQRLLEMCQSFDSLIHPSQSRFHLKSQVQTWNIHLCDREFHDLWIPSLFDVEVCMYYHICDFTLYIYCSTISMNAKRDIIPMIRHMNILFADILGSITNNWFFFRTWMFIRSIASVKFESVSLFPTKDFIATYIICQERQDRYSCS